MLVNRQYFWVIKLKKKNVWHWVYVIIVTPQLIFLFLFPVVVYFGRSFFFWFWAYRSTSHTHSLSTNRKISFLQWWTFFYKQNQRKKKKRDNRITNTRVVFSNPLSFHPALPLFCLLKKAELLLSIQMCRTIFFPSL